MPRVTNAPAARRRHKRVLRQARGFYGARSKVFKKAAEAVDRAMAMSTAQRKVKKRDYRGLWILRLSAACRQLDLSYSRFIQGLSRSGIELNRKMLSEIAIHDPDGFRELVNKAKAALA